MRRENKFKDSHTIRGCDCGRNHKLSPVRPRAVAEGEEESAPPAPKSRCVHACEKSGGYSKRRRCLGTQYGHCARCHMCHTGGSLKSMKKVTGTGQKQRWQDTLAECTEM
uniref:Uncharacterized protein n=1 Tax=Oxyrrhis marina TaxID=2969 RepID=A0A6U9K3S1_OXYMA|mmetsp:Transcript_3843/g.5923  ORF Transcript_3843/g.5923 Transcript_3843/m.5923 type:complete len:110 (-) Transcript_3843:125-454(-)